MKRFLAAALLCLLASPVLAGMNIRQNSDGSTDWVDASGNAVNVGAVYLTVLLENISTASTAAVAVPITNAHVTRVQSVLLGDITTANAALSAYVADNDGTVLHRISSTTSGNVGTLVLTAVAGDEAGDVDSMTDIVRLTGAISGMTIGSRLEQDQVIFIATDGGSTNDVDAVITITVEPDGD